MRCPHPGCNGRLDVRSTRDAGRPGRTLRYRKCRACGRSYPTIETTLSIRAIPATSAKTQKL